MRKSLLTLAALALTMTVSAQGFKALEFNGKLQKAAPAAKAGLALRHAPLKAAQLAKNQHLVGYFTEGDADNSVGLQIPGEQQAGALLEPSDFQLYIGGKVVGVRFAMGSDVTAKGVVVYNMAGSSLTQLASKDTTIASKSVVSDNGATFVWNTVMLPADQQFDLTSDMTGLMAAYKFTQTSSNYPIATKSDVARDIYLFADVPASAGGSGKGWYGLGSNYGAPAIQLIVEKSFGDNYVEATNLAVPNYNKLGADVTYTAVANNLGDKNAIYNAKVFVDGQQVATYANTDSLAAGGEDDIQGTFTLSSDLSVGQHTLSLVIDSVNGTDNGTVDTLTTTFTAYNETVARQRNLIEHYTSSSCTYCYLGDKLLQAMTKGNNDYAWVSLHGIQNPQMADPYNNAQVDSIMSTFQVGAFPSGSFNRQAVPELGGTAGLGVNSLGYQEQYIAQIAPMIDKLVKNEAAPSFVTLAVEPTFSGDVKADADKTLTLKISGTGTEGAAQLLADDALYVYFAEDSLKFDQISNGKLVKNENHNQVFRAALGSVKGNTIEWNGDNFEASYTYTVPKSWKVANTKVVAFVAHAINSTLSEANMAVNQAEQVYLKDAYNVAGIENVESKTAASSAIVAVYNAAGQRIAKAQRGLNIVRYANGKTVKVLVK